MPSYVFKVGANYGAEGTRAEPGDVLPSVPAGVLTALLDGDALVMVADPAAAKKLGAAISGLYDTVSAEPNDDRLTIEARVENRLSDAFAASVGAGPAPPAPAPTSKKKGA